MKLLEYEAKELLRSYGIPVPKSGGVLRSLAQVPAALKRVGKGPWVLKAQVLAGGRGKAGGIKIAKTPAELRAQAKEMLGMRLKTPQTQGRGLIVRELLLDQASSIAREIYFSILLDRRSGPVVIASAEGGVAIEELARTKPQAIVKEFLDPMAGLEHFQARRLAVALNIPVDLLEDFVRISRRLARMFLELDASLVEVNPLALTARGELLALDAKVLIDDNALFRHKDLAARKDPEASFLERQAKRVGISYIGLDGNIGCMVNGAGLAMGTMDTIALAGGRPANFLDVGGGADAQQVTQAFAILLKDPKVKAVLVNIFGGIMRCDTIAEGILRAIQDVKLKCPLVVRLEGTRVREGKALLQNSGLKMILADSLWDAAQKAVAAVCTART